MKSWIFLLLAILLFSGCRPVRETASQPQTVRLLFGGDLQFDRYIRQQAQRHGPEFILQPLRERLAGYDAVIANLEGSITTFPSKSVGSAFGSRNNYLFTFPPETTSLLLSENIRIVNLGNNHIGNFGQAGIAQTRANLEKGGLTYFGNTGNESANRFTIFTVRGLRIGFVNYNQFVSGGVEAALTDIDQARPLCDILVVYTHWGEEYQPRANPATIKFAHQLVDRGADLVIGSHPHVIQPMETYQGKEIYYSLGNFVFDQYFRPETRKGMLVEAVIDPATKAITTAPISIELLPTGQTTVSAQLAW